MKTILAPIDFSPITAAVVEEAARLARAFNARVVLFSAIQPQLPTTDYPPFIEMIAEISSAAEKSTVRKLERLEAQLKADFVTADSCHEAGAPIELIVGQAKKQQADYVVMGSHGHTAFYDLLVGSTTHGVLKRVQCPVVIVPSPKKEDAKAKRAKRLAKAG